MTLVDDIIVAVSVRPMTGRELATHLRVDTATLNSQIHTLAWQGRIRIDKAKRGNRTINVYSPGRLARQAWHNG